jgi:hypothetical protein
LVFWLGVQLSSALGLTSLGTPRAELLKTIFAKINEEKANTFADLNYCPADTILPDENLTERRTSEHVPIEVPASELEPACDFEATLAELFFARAPIF